MLHLWLLGLFLTGICAIPGDVEQNLNDCINKCMQATQNQGNCNNCIQPPINPIVQGCPCLPRAPNFGCRCIQQPPIVNSQWIQRPMCTCPPRCGNCIPNPPKETPPTGPIIAPNFGCRCIQQQPIVNSQWIQQPMCTCPPRCGNCIPTPPQETPATGPIIAPNFGCRCIQQPPIVNSLWIQQPMCTCPPRCGNCIPNPPQETPPTGPIIHQPAPNPEVVSEDPKPDRVLKPSIHTINNKNCCQEPPTPWVPNFPTYPTQNLPNQNFPRPCCTNSQIMQNCVVCLPYPMYSPIQKPIMQPIVCHPLCFNNIQCCNTWGYAGSPIRSK